MVSLLKLTFSYLKQLRGPRVGQPWFTAKVSTTVASHMRLSPLYQGFKVKSSGLLPSPVKPTGSKVEGRLMRANETF